MYLTGSKQCTVDAKARLTLPASIRKEFDDKVCIVPIDGALHGFTPEGHKAFLDSLFPEGFNPHSRRDVKLRRALTSRTETIEIDSAGRICLGKVSQRDRESLGLERQVMVVGNDDHFEIWNSERWEAVQAAFTDEDLDALLYGE
ncbi:MAG: MraZ family transcriptional regulator [Atopobiaceae bacterium]|jgi:MraZ protein|nr:MraZ family transcriptional regulator [Atopobiaceae bacterium]